MRQERIEFDTQGESLSGVIHLPEGRPSAAVVTTGPLTSVKEQAAGAYARALAEEPAVSAFAGVAGVYSDAAQIRPWPGKPTSRWSTRRHRGAAVRGDR